MTWLIGGFIQGDNLARKAPGGTECRPERAWPAGFLVVHRLSSRDPGSWQFQNPAVSH
jgi:hypothetical protein